jgi:hypothetical protein
VGISPVYGGDHGGWIRCAHHRTNEEARSQGDAGAQVDHHRDDDRREDHAGHGEHHDPRDGPAEWLERRPEGRFEDQAREQHGKHEVAG